MELDLNNIQWGEFNLNEIFPDIQRGKRLKKDNHEVGSQPYISSSASNNGVDGFIGNSEKVRIFENCLTIANSGSVGATFYQPFSFVASDHVTKLANEKFDKNVYLFISTITKRLSEKYSFNREINDKRIQREKIILPINLEGEPDYNFMIRYIQQKEREKIEKFRNYIEKKILRVIDYEKVKSLDQKKWKEFKLIDLFTFERGDQNNMANIEKGHIPLVSAKKIDNGYKDFAASTNKKIYSKNSLTLNNDGDGGAGISYYQPSDYLLDTHVTALFPKLALDRYTLLFISMCITNQKEKFGHGYAITGSRLNAFMIMLPIDDNDQPDFDYMKNYIKKLECEKLLKYRDIVILDNLAPYSGT